MKNLLKKLSINPNQSENSEGSNSSSRSNKFGVGVVQSNSQSKPFNAIAGWFNTMTNRKSPSPPLSSKLKRDEKMEEECSSSGGLDVGLAELELSNSKDPDIEEEYQIQLAMEMSAREDPEAVQIEAVKQISLGSCTEETTPAEVIAYRYWNYNALSYDDKILDGFYDLYGVVCESESSKIPSLLDLTAVQVSEGISWEAILVNRVLDANLVKLEQKAQILAAKARSDSLHLGGGELVRQIAILVSDYMGGPVGEPANMLRAWKSLSYSLRSTLQSMVLPLGSLTIGLARHRALLFKVLADSVGIPCRLVKGRLYTGFDDVAINTVKIDDGREFLVDLMADPGTLIPVDAALTHNIDYSDSVSSVSPLSRETGSNCGTGSSEGVSSFEEPSNTGADERGEEPHTSHQYSRNLNDIENSEVQGIASKPPAYSIFHAKSPSWTEGVSSPAVRKMKVKDVSQYMIDAAKENPQLAQKLRDVLLESGVVAPRNLFSEIYSDHSDVPVTVKPQVEGKNEGNKQPRESGSPRDLDSPYQPQFLPPLPSQGDPPRVNKALALEPHPDMKGPSKLIKNVPVAAAAAAAAAVVASSMVAAVAKSSQDPKFDLPVAAAATATAAAVVVTTAAVGKLDASPRSPGGDIGFFNQIGRVSSGDANDSSHEPQASNSAERTSDRSTGGDSASSARSDMPFDVADCEIAWEEITLGERIGLGSYGEVYRGDWHGTEVAVKKFLDQDLCGESLEEFRREIWLMKRLRHPNVVLFMGAVTRPPNLSIVTEFLHRGSLYRLIHRPNNQLDERRRLRMALDTARGMNYLHNCSPVVVHRDLKTPNLLVDKNWVVKVCDFGLSRIKNHTFLSSRSAAGTAEWMAPEVLRNEPSDEKSDVYSFGVILWELCTLKQPWEGMNPMQVVGAVGFQNRRLDIPDHLDPVVADIIHRCWQTDPKLRPTFAEIMAALKPLQKPITASHVPRPSSSRSGNNV